MCASPDARSVSVWALPAPALRELERLGFIEVTECGRAGNAENRKPNRFRITYCPGGLSREEIEGAGYGYGDLGEYARRYDVNKLADGWNTSADGEELFFVRDPAMGLWKYVG